MTKSENQRKLWGEGEYQIPVILDMDSIDEYGMIAGMSKSDIHKKRVCNRQSRVAYVDEVAFRYYNFIQADTQEEFDSFISAVEKLSYYDTGVKAEFGDELLTLSTCDREITDGRLVVLAKKRDKN